MPNLPLTPWVDVEYTISAVAAPRRGFNLGLVVGPSDVIDPSDRVVVYSSLEEMIDAGFTESMPEYEAAVLYFASPSNPTQIAIGRQASGETPLQAVQACRVANTEWYICYVTDASDSDHLAIAAYIEALELYSVYFLNTDDSDVLNNVSGNLFEELKDLNYERTLGLYSTTDHAVASIMGYAMGQTSDAANSAYTLKFKAMPGVTVDDLTTQQVEDIEDNRGNVYINRGAYYDAFENGKTFGNKWFDEIIYLDKLANDVQLNISDLLYQNPKVPQTEAGVAQVRTVAGRACDTAVNVGFLAPGKWNGQNILGLQTGDYLPHGYLVLSETIDDQEQADREARLCPPLYIAVKEAGAIQGVVVKINVNR